MFQCHCELCRKQTGTSSSSGAVVEQRNFQWLSGEHSIGKWEKSTGFTSHFCNYCGSTVPNQFRGSDLYWIPVGLLDGKDIVTVANLFECEKADWSNINSTVNSYQTKPEVESLIPLLLRENR
ncbi:GFA family protein [Salinispirillum marinum]|uniref:GFA family protein n=2 Tax=Saccharospirillaceae TaxID=255527 RepID=A0ABV8BCL2_9GAMM